VEYITITLLAIAATTFLVYLLANKVFNVRLRLKSLVWCAACALFLSLVLPRIVVSFAGLAGTVGLLAVFAIIFAYFVAYYDDPRDLQAAGSSAAGPAPQHEPTVAAVAPAAAVVLAVQPEEQAPEPAPAVQAEKQVPEPALAAQPEEQVAEPVPAAASAPEEPDPAAEFEPAVDFPAEIKLGLSLIAEPQATAPEDENGDDAPLIVLPAAATTDPAATEPADLAALPEDESDIRTDEPEPDPVGPAAVTPDPLVAYAFSADTEPQPPATEPVAGTQDDVLPKEAPKLAIPSLPASDGLEDLLEFAFAHKDAGHYQQALDAFRRVLRLYRFSEAAPFAAIEIANLLKNRGSYDEAIAVLTESRNLLALVKNEALDQEFVVTIAFLRIVKNTLLQRRLGYVPFGRIPAEINREIDAEFREWRNLAAN
jgi:tetratricopeptide (TPR) repeat protein